MKIIFVRHGKDDSSYRGGWSNLDLTPEGLEQANQLAEHLKVNNDTYHISRILSSDLTRTMTTARCISASLGLDIQQESRIRETNNGDLAGMRNDTALKRYPGLFFSTLDMEEHYPNGESPKEFYQRIKTWFDEFCLQHRCTEGTTLVVTHGGVINVIYHLVNNLHWSNKNPPFHAATCSIHVLNLQTMEFEVKNKTDHLIP